MIFETKYLDLLNDVYDRPNRQTRNAKTRSKFGVQLEISSLLYQVFPIIRGRKMHYKGVIGELAAFLKGPKCLQDFIDQGCNYWEPWEDKDGGLTVDYGNAWINFNGVNQLADVVNSLINDPYGRRHLISSWRPDRLKKLSLPCCHYAYQWYVTNDKYLNMIWIQRSVDLMIGLPSDIILAALFNLLMAQTVGLAPGELVLQLGDVHMYNSHIDAYKQYNKQFIEVNILDHDSVYPGGRWPEWTLDKTATVFNFKPSMFEITNYNPSENIKIDVIA